MREADVEFLKSYLAESEEFQNVVRWEPPRALWKGRWRTILRVRPASSGALLELRGGKRLRLRTPGKRVSIREPARELILGLLAKRFPGFRVVRVLAGTDRVRRQTASILRVLLRGPQGTIAVLAAYPGGPPQELERMFTALALWWEDLRPQRPSRAALLVPEDWNEALVRRLCHLKIPVVCCKYGPGPSLRQIFPAPPDRVEVRAPYALFPRPEGAPAPLAEIATTDRDLDLHWRFGSWELSYRGLPVAWRDRTSGECLFDWLAPQPLKPGGKARFDLHLAAVKRLRRFPSPDAGHPHFHLKPERWLESLLLRDHRLIDPAFAEVVYSQVPTCVDGERKVLDLLTATRSGRLAVLELKVEKNLELVFQALDYWERVEEHLGEGDFQRMGYFDGLDLSRRTPLLYLVTPLFEFHPALPVLRKALLRPVRFRCVGLNSDWRRKPRVLRRFEF